MPQQSNNRIILNNNAFTVGRVMTGNQYQADTEIAGQARFLQLSAINQTIDKTKKPSLDNLDGNTFLNTPVNFNQKLQIFQFAPPSDNLWNVSFKLSYYEGQPNNNNNLLQLYKNILSVNEGWSNWHEEKWKMDLKQIETSSQENVDNFIRHLCSDEIGVFLAQQINFTPFSVQVDKNPFGELQQFGGFYKNGKIVKGRNDEDSIKINFIISNWDITDLLIEPWIAAIAQNGSIMASNKDGKYIHLKADITITEYSASYPRKNEQQEYLPQIPSLRQRLSDQREYRCQRRIRRACYPVFHRNRKASSPLNN